MVVRWQFSWATTYHFVLQTRLIAAGAAHQHNVTRSL
jgi:hypothetical protein